MSDRHSSNVGEGGALDLLDRAAEISPPMSVRSEAVLEAGRRRVRRRRASALGSGALVLALAGTLCVTGPLSQSSDSAGLEPAAVSWDDGLSAQFFDNAPHPSEQGRTHWTGELRSGPGDSEPQLVLTRDGVELAPISAEGGPGEVLLFREGTLSVAVWQAPEGSLGEHLQWSAGQEWGSGGTFTVDGTELTYASAEFVAAATPSVVDLYWFTADSAHAASGAPLETGMVTAGEVSAVVMIDEARGLWGSSLGGVATHGSVHVAPLTDRGGVTGAYLGEPISVGAGPVLPNTSVGVLPEGATLGQATTGVSVGQTTVAGRTAVLATAPASTTGAPEITYLLAGEANPLHRDGVSAQAAVLEVAGAQVQVMAQPDALLLFVTAGQWATIANRDLEAGHAVVGAIGEDQVVVVPGWAPEADVADLRVQTEDGSWVPVSAAVTTALFAGEPVTVLALDDRALTQGVQVQGVGVVGPEGIVAHEVEGVTRIDLGL